jgi:hypothetical protein
VSRESLKSGVFYSCTLPFFLAAERAVRSTEALKQAPAEKSAGDLVSANGLPTHLERGWRDPLLRDSGSASVPFFERRLQEGDRSRIGVLFGHDPVVELAEPSLAGGVGIDYPINRPGRPPGDAQDCRGEAKRPEHLWRDRMQSLGRRRLSQRLIPEAHRRLQALFGMSYDRPLESISAPSFNPHLITTFRQSDVTQLLLGLEADIEFVESGGSAFPSVPSRLNPFIV